MGGCGGGAGPGAGLRPVWGGTCQRAAPFRRPGQFGRLFFLAATRRYGAGDGSLPRGPSDPWQPCQLQRPVLPVCILWGAGRHGAAGLRPDPGPGQGLPAPADRGGGIRLSPGAGFRQVPGHRRSGRGAAAGGYGPYRGAGGGGRAYEPGALRGRGHHHHP